MCIFKIGCFSLIANKELTILKKSNHSSDPMLDFNGVLVIKPAVSTAIAQLCCNLVLTCNSIFAPSVLLSADLYL